MAQRKEVLLIDDIDGKSEAAETVTFGLDGVSYEIDLTADRADDLRDELAAYVTAGRRTSGPAHRRPAPAPAEVPAPTVDYTSTDVRQWAHANGIQVSPRGRVSNDVIDQYLAAQDSTAGKAVAAGGRRPRRAAR